MLLLGYVRHLHTHKGAQKENGRRRNPNNTLLGDSQIITGAISLSRTHMQEPRGAQECTTGGGILDQRLLRNHHLVTTPPRAVTADPSVLVSRHEIYHDKS